MVKKIFTLILSVGVILPQWAAFASDKLAPSSKLSDAQDVVAKLSAVSKKGNSPIVRIPGVGRYEELPAGDSAKKYAAEYTELLELVRSSSSGNRALTDIVINWHRYAAAVRKCDPDGHGPVFIDAAVLAGEDSRKQMRALMAKFAELRAAPVILIAGNFKECFAMAAMLNALDPELALKSAFFSGLINNDTPGSLSNTALLKKELFEEAPLIAWERISPLINDVLPAAAKTRDDIANEIISRLNIAPDTIDFITDSLWHFCPDHEKVREAFALVTLAMPAMRERERKLWDRAVYEIAAGGREKSTFAVKLLYHIRLQNIHGTEAPADEFSVSGLPLLPGPYGVSPIMLRGSFSYDLEVTADSSSFKERPVKFFLEAYGLKADDTTFRSIGNGFEMTPWPLTDVEAAKIFRDTPLKKKKTWILSRDRRPVAIVTSTGTDPVLTAIPMTENDRASVDMFQKTAQSHSVVVLGRAAIWEKTNFNGIRSVPVFPGVFPPDSSITDAVITSVLKDENVRPVKRILVLGCGSGADAVRIAREYPDAVIEAVDIQPLAVANTKALAEKCGLSSRIKVRQSDAFGNVDGKYDLVLLNAPVMIPDKKQMDMNVIDPGGKFIKAVLDGLAGHLNEHGRMYAMALPAAAVKAEAEKRGLLCKVFDVPGEEGFTQVSRFSLPVPPEKAVSVAAKGPAVRGPGQISDMIREKLKADAGGAIVLLDTLWSDSPNRYDLEEALARVTQDISLEKGAALAAWLNILRGFSSDGNIEKMSVTNELEGHIRLQEKALRPLVEDSFSGEKEIPLPRPFKASPVVLRGSFSFSYENDPVRFIIETYGMHANDTTFRDIGNGFAMTPWPIPDEEYFKIFEERPSHSRRPWILSCHRVPVAVVTGGTEAGDILLLYRLTVYFGNGDAAIERNSEFSREFIKPIEAGKAAVAPPLIFMKKGVLPVGRVPIFPDVFRADSHFTEALIEQVLPEIESKHKVLVLGTGSGIEAVTIALKNPGLIVDATDIQPLAVANTKALAALYGVSDRVRVWQSDGFLKVNGKYDRIVLHAPKIQNAGLRSPDVSVVDEEGKFITSVLDGLPPHLNEKGKFIVMCLDDKWLEDQAAQRGYDYKRLAKDTTSAVPILCVEVPEEPRFAGETFKGPVVRKLMEVPSRTSPGPIVPVVPRPEEEAA